MTGEKLVELMGNSELKEELAKHARRYSKDIEDQEEYIQDAWLRIAEHPDGRDLEYYAEQGRKEVYNSYHKQYRKDVAIKNDKNGNGISTTGKDAKPPPKRAVNLYRNKYLDTKYRTLDWQYYEGQEKELDENAHLSARWYNQYGDFDTLTKREKDKIVNWFRCSGYHVGKAIGATPGKKTRFYEMYYTVEDGVVVKAKAPHTLELNKSWPVPGSGSRQKMDLSSWYKLRDLGGSNEWMEKLNSMISWLEEYIEWE